MSIVSPDSPDSKNRGIKMKKSMLILLFIFLVSGICYAQDSDWEDSGNVSADTILRGHAIFLAGTDKKELEEPFRSKINEYTNSPEDAFKDIKLKPGWHRIALATPAILPAGKNIRFSYYSIHDSRWFRFSDFTVQRKNNQLHFSLKKAMFTAPHIKNYMPSLEEKSVLIESLLIGEYAIYFNTTLIGNIHVVKPAGHINGGK